MDLMSKLRTIIHRSLSQLANSSSQKTFTNNAKPVFSSRRSMCTNCRSSINAPPGPGRSRFVPSGSICVENRSLLRLQQRMCLSSGGGENKVREELLTDEEIRVLKELKEEEALVKKDKLRASVSQEYVSFENNQRVIQDVNEEMWNPLPQVEQFVYEPPEEFRTRGKMGVFDLGELVDLIREENGREIVAVSIPKEFDYADHMVVVTARNPRHLLALADYVRKRYKMKQRKSSDVIPAFVTKDGQHGWIAFDLGNIILHVFLQAQRDYYDLEMLWTVGPLFDDLCNMKDPEIIQLLNTLK